LKRDGGEWVVLILTLAQLEDLTGYAAAESDHARTARQREDLGSICDYFEGLVFDTKSK
jgi:hypothetical protein